MNQINIRQPYLTKTLTFVFLRIMRSVLLFRIKNCRCNSMAISPLKILIIFEIWSLGSGFFTYKQKIKKKSIRTQLWLCQNTILEKSSGMFSSPYFKTYQDLGLKRCCFCPWCTSPNLPEIKSFVHSSAGVRRYSFKRNALIHCKQKDMGDI